MPIQTLTDEVLRHQLDLLRLQGGVTRQVLALLNALQRELVRRLALEDLTAWSKQRLQSLLTETTIAINDYYAQAQALVTTTMAGVGQAQAAHVGATITRLFPVLGGGLPTATFLERLVSNVLIEGAASADWWRRQRQDTTFRFANAVRQGMVQGETVEQIARRVAGSPRLGITGIMDIARSNARSLVHTSIQTVANASRVKTFEENFKGEADLQWLATLDSSTCQRCAPRDMHLYKMVTHESLDGGLPWDAGPGALHWSCRCVTTVKPREIPGMPPLPVGQRASATGPVNGNTRFVDYLERQGQAFQDAVLGSGRAQLWRDGKLTLEQLLDLSGNPLTLAQLRAKYG